MVIIPCSWSSVLIESSLLRTTARGTTSFTLETGTVSYHSELLTLGTGISLIALLARHLDGGQGQCFTLEFDCVRHIAMPISVAIALMTRYRRASRWKHFCTDRS